MNTSATNTALADVSMPITAIESGSAGRTLRLLMIAFNFPPAATAGVHRTLRFTKYLPDFGCVPTVLTRNCEPDSGGEQLLSQVPASVLIDRVGVSPEPAATTAIGDLTNLAPSIPSGSRVSWRSMQNDIVRAVKHALRPAWDLLTETPDQYIGWSRQAAYRGIELCRNRGFDVIYTTGPPHSTHLAGCKIKRATGLPWIADFRDPWARRPWAKARNPWGQRLLPYFERKVACEANCVILNNDASAADFRRAYSKLPPEKFISIPNGYDPDLLPLADRLRQRRRQQLQPFSSRPAVICHPGTLYGQRDPSPVLEAIACLHREGLDVRFQQLGTVGPRFDLARLSQQLGIVHLVEHIPPVPHAEAMEYMSQADVLLIIQPNGPLMVPGKLYEMLLFDQPIVAVCDSAATSETLATFRHTWSASCGDTGGITTALRSALRSRPTEAESAERRDAHRRFEGRQLAEVLSKAIASTLSAHSAAR